MFTGGFPQKAASPRSESLVKRAGTMSLGDHRWTTSACATRLRAACCALGVAVLLTLTGCAGTEESNLSDFLDELEFDSHQETHKEVLLGEFQVSAATRAQDSNHTETSRIWVQIKCKLYVIVALEDETAVLEAFERHKGMLDDVVVRVFRSSTTDELSDPRWSAIKSRISDGARPILGENRVRQIVIDDFGWQPI
jgi:hypothetical protein